MTSALAARVQAARRPPLLQVVKTVVATVAAWFLAILVMNVHVPVFAAIAAIIVVQPSVGQSLSRALERVLGVILGVLVALGATVVLGPQSWLVLVAIVASLAVGWLFRLTAGSANQVAISAMLVITIGAATPGYAFERILETALGAVVGLIVNLVIVPPVQVRPARVSVHELAAQLADVFDHTAEVLTVPQAPAGLQSLLEESRSLRPVRDAATAAVLLAEESLTMNPRAGRLRDELAADRELLSHLNPLVTRSLGMSRALRDHYDVDLLDLTVVRAIARELTRAARDLRLIADREAEAPGTATTGPVTAQLPTLTEPLRVAKPHPVHWILIGSLLEDLRRIREEIVEAS